MMLTDKLMVEVAVLKLIVKWSCDLAPDLPLSFGLTSGAQTFWRTKERLKVGLTHSMVMHTVVLEHEEGVILKYPPLLGSSLVHHPYGHSSTGKAAAGSKRNKKSGKKVRVKLNKGEKVQRQYHAQIEERLTSCYQTLLAIGRKIQYFPVQPGSVDHHHQDVSLLDFESLCNLDALIPIQGASSPLLIDGDYDEELNLFGHLIHNPGLTSVTVRALGKRFHIPSKSSFLLSDLSKIDLLLTHAELKETNFGLVVIDPPWENRSAIRGKKYTWISNEQLLQLPIPSLVSPQAVVAVWVTNKRSIASFVRDVLFPSWNIDYVGEWHWIKVTTEGELVWPMDSTHKKPYETLLIGRVRSCDHSHLVPDLSLHEEPVPETYQKDQKTQPAASSMVASGNKSTTEIFAEIEAHDTDNSMPLSIVEQISDHQQEDKATLQTLISSVKRPTGFSAGAGEHLERTPPPPSQTLVTSIDSHLERTPQSLSQILVTSTQCPTGLVIVDSHLERTPLLDQPLAKKHKPDNVEDRGPSLSCHLDLPSQLCFLAVPSCVHSQKPYLGDVLDKYIPEGCDKLELFARNLLPGWTSWGNEVLKFQVTD